MTPRVAIVIRTKNRPYFLARALGDLLDQKFGEWEAIVANDGGDTDEALRQIASVSDRAAGRIRLVDVDGEGGRCAAANQGIRASAAPLVVLHDDDDLWDPHFLARTVAWLDENPADAGVMVTTEILYEEKVGDSYVDMFRAPFWQGQTQVSFSQLLTVNRAVPISFLYRRSLHEALGYYDETLAAVEDWEFYLRVTLAHHIGYLAGEPLATWTQRPNERGSSGNSMYALGDIHERSDRQVRDRALRDFAREFGTGLPLYMAGLIEVEVRRHMDQALAEFADVLRGELDARHPIWSRVRRWRQRARAHLSAGKRK